jgi:hypothetical protein
MRARPGLPEAREPCPAPVPQADSRSPQRGGRPRPRAKGDAPGPARSPGSTLRLLRRPESGATEEGLGEGLASPRRPPQQLRSAWSHCCCSRSLSPVRTRTAPPRVKSTSELGLFFTTLRRWPRAPLAVGHRTGGSSVRAVRKLSAATGRGVHRPPKLRDRSCGHLAGSGPLRGISSLRPDGPSGRGLSPLRGSERRSPDRRGKSSSRLRQSSTADGVPGWGRKLSLGRTSWTSRASRGRGIERARRAAGCRDAVSPKTPV